MFPCGGLLHRTTVAASLGLAFGLREFVGKSDDQSHSEQPWLRQSDPPPEHFSAIDAFRDPETGLSCVHLPLCFGKDFGTSHPLQFSVDVGGASCFVKGQGACNNCYAHAVSGMVSDRICIHKWKKEKRAITPDLLKETLMSPQDLTSCGGGNGCEAGHILNSIHVAVENVAKYGIVSYDCMPYWSWEGLTGECPDRCRDGSPKVHHHPKRPWFHNVARKLRKQPNYHKWLIYNGGPLVAGFDFPPDFKPFLFGGAGNNGHGDVYIPTATMELGSAKTAHAVKIVGWGSQQQVVHGVEANVPYWLCQNSWGPDAVGDDRAPFFKVIREAEGLSTFVETEEGERLPLLYPGVTMNIEGSMYAIEGPFDTTVDNEWVMGPGPVQDTIFSIKGQKNHDKVVWANYAEAMCAYYGDVKIWDVGCEDWLEKTTVGELRRLCDAYDAGCPARGRKTQLVKALVKRMEQQQDLSYDFVGA